MWTIFTIFYQCLRGFYYLSRSRFECIINYGINLCYSSYRSRLSAEWKEQNKIWRVIDKKAEIVRHEKRRAFIARQNGTDGGGPEFGSGEPEVTERFSVADESRESDAFPLIDKMTSLLRPLSDEELAERREARRAMTEDIDDGERGGATPAGSGKKKKKGGKKKTMVHLMLSYTLLYLFHQRDLLKQH